MEKVDRGENGTVEWPVLKSDGTPLDLSACTLIQAEYMQQKNVRETFVHGDDDEIRISEIEENVLIIEYPIPLTERLDEGPVTLKITLEIPDDTMSDGVTRVEFDSVVFEIK